SAICPLFCQFSDVMEGRNRLCLVCSDRLTSMHLGMDICRPCASFFKRSTTAGVNFPCRQGKKQCVISKENGFMCRHCRYEKCLSVGVAYDGPLRPRAKPVTPILELIDKEFKSLIERRKVKELELMRTTANSGTIPHPGETIYYVGRNCSVDIYAIAVAESWVFFENAFPTLKQIPKEEKDMIFKDYIPKLCLIVSYFLTRKLWGDAHKKTMCSVVTCFDTQVPFSFYYPKDNGNKKLFESSIRSYSDDHSSFFVPQFDRAKITEAEFHALTALAMAENDLRISEETQQIIDKIRSETFENLQSYYQNEMGIVNFSTRLGNLMSLNHIIQECMSLHKVFFRFFATFFDMYMSETVLKR
ncbi:hypothetical protein PMAYCL1PPCAC_15416, partial [Pristionchus mayeri]